MLYDILAKLYNCMLSHGVSPNDMLVGTMIPLQKDRRSAHHCSTNYRALTLGSIVGKLYDSIIINQQAHVFNTSELQFGFKEKSSTTQCTFLVNETISYYVNNGTPVYALLLDASKAFDRVNYILLFKKLIKKGMCPLVVRLLLNMYTRQQLQVRWNTNVSAPFTVTNGVRQGGVMSPLLFGIYVDGLLERLEKSGIGCNVGTKYCGAIGYADDVILLVPSISGLRKMINICEQYALEHDVIFNGKKSKLLLYDSIESQT